MVSGEWSVVSGLGSWGRGSTRSPFILGPSSLIHLLRFGGVAARGTQGIGLPVRAAWGYQIDHENREVRIVAVGVKDRDRLLVGGEEVTL